MTTARNQWRCFVGIIRQSTFSGTCLIIPTIKIGTGLLHRQCLDRSYAYSMVDAEQILYGATPERRPSTQARFVWSALPETSILIKKLDKDRVERSRISLLIDILLDDLGRIIGTGFDRENVNIQFLDRVRYDSSPCVFFEFLYQGRDPMIFGFPASPLEQVRSPQPVTPTALQTDQPSCLAVDASDAITPIDWLWALELLADTWGLSRPPRS